MAAHRADQAFGHKRQVLQASARWASLRSFPVVATALPFLFLEETHRSSDDSFSQLVCVWGSLSLKAVYLDLWFPSFVLRSRLSAYVSALLAGVCVLSICLGFGSWTGLPGGLFFGAHGVSLTRGLMLFIHVESSPSCSPYSLGTGFHGRQVF